MGLTIFQGIFPDIFTFSMNVEYLGILSVPQNIVMDLNNVMKDNLWLVWYILYLVPLTIWSYTMLYLFNVNINFLPSKDANVL